MHIFSIKISFIHNTDKKCYCSVGMKLLYFLIFYHCSLLLLYSSHLVSLLFLNHYLFSFFNFFHYWFPLFLVKFTISHQVKCYILRYGLDSTIIGSRITLIMCSFPVQRNNLKQQLAALLPLHCIHAHHVSNNLNVA